MTEKLNGKEEVMFKETIEVFVNEKMNERWEVQYSTEENEEVVKDLAYTFIASELYPDDYHIETVAHDRNVEVIAYEKDNTRLVFTLPI